MLQFHKTNEFICSWGGGGYLRLIHVLRECL
jgi:hypothetical protein